jgi:hypothetical protein
MTARRSPDRLVPISPSRSSYQPRAKSMREGPPEVKFVPPETHWSDVPGDRVRRSLPARYSDGSGNRSIV